MRCPVRRRISGLSLLLVCLSVCAAPSPVVAAENPFPLLPGLESAVEFWRLVFTRYGRSEVVFYDTEEPLKIYKVANLDDDPSARRLIKEEIERISQAEGFAAREQRVRAQRGVRERFASGLALSRRYLDQIQRILGEEGVPVELAYLPLVESAFDVHARSRAGALGMWQFMPSTGRKFLRVSSTVDERKDPLESTRAAAKLLKQNYEMFGNWPLAITAYNHGREGIQRAVAEVGSSDLAEIIRGYQHRIFGFASKSFYAEFLAALEVAQRREEFFPGLGYHAPRPLEELAIDRTVSIAALLKPVEISHAEFLEWNPALSPKIKDIPGGYLVKVPAEKLEAFVAAYRQIVDSPANKAKLLAFTKESVSWILHEVAPGETLSQIARSYRVSVDAIQRANGLESSHRIAAGQQLKIPKKA